MRRTRVSFNGLDLTSSYLVSNLRAPLLPRTLETTDVPGMDGVLYSGVRLAARSVTLTLTARGNDLEERQMAARLLAGALAVSEPRPLYIDIDSGIYYMAVPVSGSDPERFVNATSFDVSFECPDPVAYGVQRTVTVPSSGSVTFTVGGTYRAMPTVEGKFRATAANQLWRMTLDDGSFLAYEPAYSSGSSAKSTIVAECLTRSLKVDGVTKLLIPTADWLELSPGEHTLQLNGSVAADAATVTYNERWL